MKEKVRKKCIKRTRKLLETCSLNLFKVILLFEIQWNLQKEKTKYCYIVIYTFMQHHNDTTSKTDAWINDAWKRRRKDFFRNILPLTLLQGFERLACERMLETNINFIFWPYCYDITLCLYCSPNVGVYSIRAFRGPLGLVWPSLPHLVSTVWSSTGNCIGGFRGSPQSGVAFPTTSRL